MTVLPDGKKFDMFSHFECVTDGQTELRQHMLRFVIESRGKNDTYTLSSLYSQNGKYYT